MAKEPKNLPHYEVLEEGEETNVVELKIVKPAGDTTIPSGNWLLDMKKGTEFVVKDKDPNNFMLARFTVVDTDNVLIVHLFLLNKDLSEAVPFGEVDPIKFIRRFDRIKTILPQEETENE